MGDDIPAIGQEFPDPSSFDAFVRSYARNHGFKVNKSFCKLSDAKSKRLFGTVGHIQRGRMFCRRPNLQNDAFAQRQTCPFFIRMVLNDQ